VAKALLRQAEAGVEAWDEVEATELRGEVAALRALASSMLGDERATDLGLMALAELPEHHPLRGVIVSGLSFAYFSAGDLSPASHLIQEALAAHQRQHLPNALRAALIALLAMVRRAQGRLREVRRLSEQVLELTTSDGRTLPLAGALLAYLLLGLTQCEQNDLDGA